MKSGKSYKRNLLLAATIVSLSTTMIMQTPVKAETLYDVINSTTGSAVRSYNVSQDENISGSLGTLGIPAGSDTSQVTLVGDATHSIIGTGATGVSIPNGGTLIVNNIKEITGFYTKEQAGGFANVAAGGKITITNTSFKNNSDNFTPPEQSVSVGIAQGAALYNAGKAEITGGSFISNTVSSSAEAGAAYGGAIYNTGNFDINGTLFSGNTATSHRPFGGAIYSNNSSENKSTIQNATFKNNHALMYSSYRNEGGGAIYNNDGTIEITGSTFGGSEENEFNSSSNDGAAIYNNTNGKIVLNSSNFINNQSYYKGNAIYNKGELVVENGNTFKGGSLENTGNLIYSDTGSTLKIGKDSNSLNTFSDSTYSSGNGMIRSLGALNLNGTLSFKDNNQDRLMYITGTNSGYSLSSNGVNNELSGLNIQNNNVSRAIYLEVNNSTPKITLKNNSFTGNYSQSALVGTDVPSNNYGLIYVYGNGEVDVDASNTFEGNKNIYLITNVNGTVNLSKGFDINNSTNAETSNDAFILSSDTNGVINLTTDNETGKSLVAKNFNIKGYGAALTLTGGTVNTDGIANTIKNAVFENNTASRAQYYNYYYGGEGGAVYLKDINNLTFDNVTFKDNTANSGYGGALAAYGSNIDIKNSLFDGNKNKSTYGSAIYYKGNYTNSNLSIADTTFTNNRRDGSDDIGYVVYANGYNKFDVSGETSFTQNTGGAIYASGFDEISIKGNDSEHKIQITNNTNSGISLSADKLTIDHVNIQGNTGATGVFYNNHQGSSVDNTINDLTIKGNTFTGTNTYGINADFSSNNGELTISNSTIEGNTFGGTANGSAPIRMQGKNTANSKLTLNNVTIQNNTWDLTKEGYKTSAGAVSAPYATLVINNSIIKDNTTTGSGAINSNLGTKNVEITDTSITGNTASNYGGGIYTYYPNIFVTAENSNVSISENTAQDGGAIYSDGGSATLYAKGKNLTVENNTTTNANGVGIYVKNSLDLKADNSNVLKVSDSIKLNSSTSGLNINADNNTGIVDLSGAITNSGAANIYGGTLKLSGNALTNKFNTFNVKGNSTIDLSNNGSAADNMKIGTLASENKTLTLNVDYNGTANSNNYGSMDKLTVDNVSGALSLDLNNINILTDGDATKAVFLDGDGASNVTILNSEVAREIASSGGFTYTFTHDTTTKGLLNISRVEHQYDLPKLIAGEVIGIDQYAITTDGYKPFQIPKEGTADEYYTSLGTLTGANREFTISGGSAETMHSIDGTTMASAKGDGVEVGSGQTLNLRNISQFKNFTTAVDNAGTLNVENVTFTDNTTDINNTNTLNLTGNNTINTIADADTATGTININSGRTIFTGNTKQNTIAVATGAQLENRGTVTGDVTANINGATDYSIINKGTMTVNGATFKNTAIVVDTPVESDAHGGALYSSGSGTLTITDSLFEGNSSKQTGTSYRYLSKGIVGGALSSESTNVVIDDTVFKNNFTETVDDNIASYGGAAYLRGTNLSLTGTYEYDSENPEQIIDSSTKFVGNRAGSKDSFEHGYGGALVTNFSGTDNVIDGVIFKQNLSNIEGGALRNQRNLKTLSAYFDSNSVESSIGRDYFTESGGAIRNNGTITNLSSTFVNNFALNDYVHDQYQLPSGYTPKAMGGAVYNGETITNLNSDFIGNYADATYFALGGALVNATGATIGTISSTFKDNYVINHKQGRTSSGGTDAYANGGAIYNDGTINLIKDSVFEHNSALTTNEYNKAYGSAIYNAGTITTIQDSIFRNNTSGGVIYNFKTIGTITGSEFSNNEDTAIVNTRYRSLINEISDSTFTGNSNGAILNSYTEYSDNAPVVIKSIDGTFTGNNRTTASYRNLGGGAIQNSVTSGYNQYTKSTAATIGNWDEEQQKFVGNAITGDFENNYVISANNNAGGGAIANFTSYQAGKAEIGDIAGKTPKGFKGNHVIVTGSGYSAMGGAIFNKMDPSTSNDNLGAKIGNITANFTENYVQAVDEALGGAIYSVDDTGIIKGNFTGNYATAKDARGGAIAGVLYLNIEDSSFYNNYTSGTTTSLGGAVYNEGTTIIKAAADNIVFRGNKANYGAGVYMGHGWGTLALYAKGGDISFENNNRTGEAGGNGTGIHSDGYLTLVAEEGKKITINDKVQVNKNMNINSGLTNLISPVGTVEFTDTIYAAGNNSELYLNGGTLKLNAEAAKVLNTDLNTSSDTDAFEKFVSSGGTLDIQNNNIDKIKPLSSSGSNISGAINWYIDVNTTANTGDKFVSDILAENVGVGSVIIKAINIINDDADDATIQVGLGSVSQIMKLANDYVLTGGNYDVAGVYDAEGHAYYLNLTAVNYDSINGAITADDRLNKSYTLKNQGESGGETVTGDLGALVGDSLTVNGKGLFLNGTVNEEKKKGFVLGKDLTTEHNQTLTLKNMTVKNFEVAVTNNEGGTLNVQNVTFTDNTDPSGEMAADILNQGTANISGSTIAGIYNDSVLNLSGNNTITNIYDGPTLDDEAPITGVTNITGGLTTIVSGGVVTQKTINMQGGNLRLVSSTVNSDIVGDADFNTTGKLEIASGTINGNITGTFKNNERIIGGAILYNSNSNLAINNANFVSNAATQIGGAIVAQTTGTNSITNTTFTGNSATNSSGDAYGGAIYQEGGILSISNSTFGGTEEGQGNSVTSTTGDAYGGAIYNNGGNLTITDSTFSNNSASATGTNKYGYGGAIYQTGGTLSVKDSKFISNSASGRLYGYGGAIYLKDGSSYSITGTKTGTGTSATSTTEFVGNNASEGAALNIKNTSGTIDGVVFKENKNSDNIGMVLLVEGTQEIKNSSFIGNEATDTMGCVVDNRANSLTIDNSEFINNNSTYTVHAYQAGMTIKNSEFSGNGVADKEYSSVIYTQPYSVITNIYDTNIKNNKATAITFSDSSQMGNTLNIIADKVGGGVEISGNSGYGIKVQPQIGTATTSEILLYAKNGNILINNNTKGGIANDIGFSTLPALTLNADTDHNITINDSITYKSEVNKGSLNINSEGNAGTVALNGALTLGESITVGGGTLELGSDAVTSLAQAITTNNGVVKLTGGTLTQNIAGATTITGTVIDNNATLGNVTITNTGNFTDNGGAFTTADNAGTFNVNGVTLTAAGTSINNTATLNLSGENYIKTITGSTGNTYITGGTTTISQNGSATQKVINISDGELIADYGTTITATEGVKLQGGTLKAQNGATVNNIIADEHYTGNRLVVLGGGFSSLEGTFKGSNTYRALDYNSATALTIDGVTFDSNAAGAIYHSWSGTVDSSISNSTFTNNSNEYDGGAYYQFSTNGSDHTVSFNNVTFTSNSATNKGGAILAGLNAVNKLNISNSTFTSNTVTSANGIGSAIYLQGIAGAENTPSSFTIDNSTFTSNGAGGVVYANGGNLTVKNSTFTSNSGDAIVLADNYQYWTIIGGQITAVYSPITANIVAETGNVSITGNSGWGIVGNNNHETESALTLYAKSGNITINGNTAGGINNNGLVLTLNADEDHNITIADAVSSTTGMMVNDGGTHAGTVALNGNLANAGTISVGGGTLELGSNAVTSLANAIETNNGTVKLTGGTLTQAIAGNTTVSGSDVTLGTNGSLVNATVANGAKLTSQASQFTTMNNLGTLLLSGTLDKAISGTGETKINQTLTFAEGENPAKASIAGTLNMNSGTLNMVEEETPAYTNYTVGTLKGSGNLAIDFDGTNTDKLTITTADETPITVTLTALNGFTKGQDAVPATTILSGASNITLEISDTLRTAYNETTHEDVYHTDTIVSNANWDTEFKNRYFDKETGKQLVVNNDTANKTLEYKYTVEEHADETKDISLGDTLALVNQKEDTTRTFTTTDKTATYNVGSVLGETGAGKITVQGATEGTNTSTLNMAGNTGFVVGSGAEVELNTVKITNTANSDGSLINNTAGTATLNNVEIASNSVNVISSSGTLGVTNSTVNTGVNNDGTMNLIGTNQIASVEGSNGTAYVQTGTTTVGSIFQKLISTVSDGKLASNGDVTATNGIANATADGLSITNGKLTGNVTGEGSTKFSGTSSIANGSVVGQAITVVDGKLTTLANGLGGAVTNGGTVELTGGNLTNEISGVSGSTVINTASDVTIGTDGLISQTLAIQAGTLKTGVNGFTQNITSNAGVVELTGTGSLNKTIAGNTTVSGTDITNNGSLANVTIADGGVLTSASDKISGTINNGGTLKLSGNLNKTISGSGETIANSDLAIGTSASVEGKLNANGNTLNMSGDSLATQTNVGTLKGNGKLSVDVVNNSGTIVSDSIKATNYNSIAYEITNITGLDSVISGLNLTTTTGDSTGFNLTVLDGYTGSGLTVANSVISAYTGAKQVDRSHTEELTAIADWNKKFTKETWKDNYNQTWTSTDGKLAYTATKTGETDHSFADGDTLQMLNTTTNFGTDERKFVTTDKNAIHNVSTDLGSTSAGTMTVQGATDGTNTSTIDMKGKTGFVVSNAGTTLNLDTVNITGAKAEDSSLINNSQGTVNINNVTVANNANNVITNNNEMNLTGTNTINAGVNGTNGTTNVKSGISIIDRITQKVVEIFTGAKLQTESIAATNGVTNAGDLEITGTSNTSNISGNGSTKFTNDVNNSGSISQNEVEIASGKTLTTTGNISVNELSNGGTVTVNNLDAETPTSLTINGGTAEAPTTIGGTINGTGSTVIEGNAQNNGTIASAVEIATSGKLSTNADKVTGAINNDGNLDLTGGDIKNAISGDGNTTISGTVTNSTGKNIGNAITVASTGNLTTAADKIGGTVENNGTTNGLTLTGGQLSQNVTGSGKTVIAGTDVSVKYGNSIAQDIEITSGNKLVNTNVSSIGGDVENNGDIQLYSQDNGKLEHDITGTGTTELNRDITVAANIDNTINIKSYTDGTGTHNANITVESGNNFGKAGQNITVDSNNSLTMQSASDIKGNLVDNGTVELQGGTISSAISGSGAVNITGNIINNAANTVTGAVSVAENVELAIGTSGNTFNSASSLTMGNGSTLNLQNGSADIVNDNLAVATDKIANLAMDWGDSIGSTNNINGKLNVSDVDLTATTSATTPTSYAIATGSNLGNVVLDESVNLKTNDTSFNQVKYNSTTGAFTGAKNNLAQAVNTTEDGESAIYSMSSNEPAGTLGAGVLDGGKLIVQGNGNTITGYGIEVGDGTHNAILTIKDANMKDITGDALLVKGGNTVTVMAENSDIEISGTTGNAITLNKDTNGNSTVNINGGSHTVTIENDIISDDSGNTIKFNSGTINFNGKFDPAAAVVGGATVNRGGDDDDIDWTVTSGTLNYLQDSYLNRATNTMNLNGGTLNTVNGVVTDFALGGFTLSNDSNFYADVDLAAGKMDNFISTPTTYTGGTLHVAGLNLISDATADNTSIPFANSTLAGHVDYTGAQGLTALSPIYKYNVGYNSSNGNFDFARYNSGGYDGLNPAIMAAPVAAQMGGYLTQLNSYDEAFRNMDMYMLMTAQQRQALKNKNKVASIDGGVLYDATLMRQERAEGWFRPFATFEKVGLRNGPKVENIAYGTYMGGESQMYDLGHGWDGIWGAYVGYNGSHQNYDGVSIYQNGGTLGVLGMAYKGNFFTGLTINAGASGVEASTMYGNEDFAMLMAGIASKTGYNWELFNGKFIIQPSMLMSYSFVNTFDYKNAAGVNVDSDPLHAIQLQPELKFIGNLKNGWQPYASVAMVWNIMDNTKFKANDVSLPELSVKPYVKYGVGVRKTWGERLTGFFQTYLTNGGRNGVGLQAGFTWAFGGGKNKKADEQKIQKSLNKTPELKKTEIVLNGKKVQ